MENHSDSYSTTSGMNTSEQSTKTNNIRIDGTKQKQNTDFIGQRNEPQKDQPKNVAGTDIGVYTPDIQPEP